MNQDSNLETITINELADLLGVSTHTLRYWEKQLSIDIERNEKGHRFYSKKAVFLFTKIRDLVSTKLELKNVKNKLNQEILSYNEVRTYFEQKEEKPKIEVIQNYKNDFDDTSKMEFYLKPFIAQLDKAHNEIRGLVSENAELKGKVRFFELKAQDHEKTLQKVLEAKEESIGILREENTKKETELKDLKFKLEDLNSKEEALDSLKGQMDLLNNKVLEYQQNLEALQNKKWWKFWE